MQDLYTYSGKYCFKSKDFLHPKQTTFSIILILEIKTISSHNSLKKRTALLRSSYFEAGQVDT